MEAEGKLASSRPSIRARPARRTLAIAAWLTIGPLLVALQGCAGLARPATQGAPPELPDVAGAASTGPQVGARPWMLRPQDLGYQSLFRLRYDGPEGDGSLKLTLRLLRPDAYRINTADPLGRSLWTLEVRGERGLWLDHRAEAFCRVAGRIDLEALPLSPFELPSLPSVLLGRLPVAPADTPRWEGDRLTYSDARGRRWSSTLEAGNPATWMLFDGDDPVVWWHRAGQEAILSERRRGIQVRWRRTVQEPIGELPPALEAPPTFVEACPG